MSDQLTQLRSQQDKSVNLITSDGPGLYEFRYVRRNDDKASFYVSSQSGCEMHCRMCGLTQTGQTSSKNASLINLIKQIDRLLIEYANSQPPAKVIHINFMARGEPLLNTSINRHSLDDLKYHVEIFSGVPTVPIISTIAPARVLYRLTKFPEHTRIYYSLYSTNETWRKKWFPRAADCEQAIRVLQSHPGEVRLHMPFIAGENDSPKDVDGILDAAKRLQCKINVIRFNPQGSRYDESPFLSEIVDYMTDKHDQPVKIVDRVGEDVHASCGMFYAAEAGRST